MRRRSSLAPPNRQAPPAAEVLSRLRARASPANVAGMARYGISTRGTLGVTVAELRRLARELGAAPARARHRLASDLWDSGVHEARILAAILDEPILVGEAQAERWAADLDSWDVCDQLCASLLRRTAFAWRKVREWAGREEPFVKRAGFALATQLAVHDRDAPDADFLPVLALVEREAGDGRNYVRKAVSWALRCVGKRSPGLRRRAAAAARRLAARPEPSARWVGRDALRDLTGEAVRRRLSRRRRQPRTRPSTAPSGRTR
ncbi:MAG TPA: DNA alkylation repair protein [Anaeromyxobacteraceae bacterium]|nr:DNA alkylation repair protein [Anaeromyxobacteraceae bacterium]